MQKKEKIRIFGIFVLCFVATNAFARADFVVLYPRTPVLPKTLKRVTEPLVIEKKEPQTGPILVVQSGRCFEVSSPVKSGQ